MSVKSRLLAGVWALTVLIPIGIDTIGLSRAQAPPNADGLVMPNGPATSTFMYVWNGTGWDRVQGTGGAIKVNTQGSGVTVNPGTATAIPAAGTIAAVNTFQTAIGSNAARKGCRVINKGTDILYVSFLTGNGLAQILAPAVAGPPAVDGGMFDCSSASGVVATNAISVASPTQGNVYMTIVW